MLYFENYKQNHFSFTHSPVHERLLTSSTSIYCRLQCAIYMPSARRPWPINLINTLSRDSIHSSSGWSTHLLAASCTWAAHRLRHCIVVINNWFISYYIWLVTSSQKEWPDIILKFYWKESVIHYLEDIASFDHDIIPLRSCFETKRTHRAR